MKLQITPVALAIHKEGESPIYSESAIQLSLQDLGGGYFFQITQDSDKLEVELDELKKCVAAAEFLLNGVENKINEMKI